MSQVITVTFTEGNEWKLPFNFALFLHLSILLSAVYGPALLNKKPLYEDIYTVDLISVEEPAIPPVVEKPPIPPTPKNEKDVPAVSIAKTPDKPVVEESIKPVSIKPLKKKKIKKITDTDSQKKKLEQLHKKNLEEVRETERRAAEAARIAASEAVTQLKDMLRESSIIEKQDAPKNAATTSRRSQKRNSNVVENQYYASVFSRLQPHWKLPEYKTWNKELVATIVIRIAKDGTIQDQFFEKKSGDRIFDQFVLQALRDGSPLPPIPAALQKNDLEIGLNFKPGSINF